MCGIAGFFGAERRAAVPVDALRLAGERMQLRGPDAAGEWMAEGVGFVHRRLTVIDLAGGWQPMVDAATGVALTYNGEIYNFKVLRRELEGRGHRFLTQSDTEVLLRGWLEWGRRCLDRLVGIFAFAIYDPRVDILFLARDRMGAKPLYFAETASGVQFASTVAALLAFDEVTTEIDEVALLHYFKTIRTTLGAQTLLRDVATLEPGCCLIAQRGEPVHVQRYWDFPVIPADEKRVVSLEESIETVRAMVEESIQEQMVSDVPLGGFLSGGIDSCVIAAVASRRGVFGAYNVGYEEHACNEWPYVRMAAEHFGVSCREIPLMQAGYADTWQFLLREKGLPLSTPNEVPIYHLAHALRQDYTVALSGEGADELFGGYVTPYFSAYDYDRARRVPLEEGDLPNRTDRAMMRLYQQAHLGSHVEHHFLQNSWIAPNLLPVVVQESLFRQERAVELHYEGLYRQFEGCTTFDKYMHLHARINLEGLLNRVDSSTMAASVEGRVPFTDHRLAEYLFAQPDAHRMNWMDDFSRTQGRVMNVAEIDNRQYVESKILLRRAFSDQIPRPILERKKVSFPVPFREWLGGTMKPFAAEMIQGSALVERYVNPEVLELILNGQENALHGMLLWPIVNLAMWERELGSLKKQGW
jgi:asparagine synthase (glutamine-hydrolysing)